MLGILFRKLHFLRGLKDNRSKALEPSGSSGSLSKNLKDNRQILSKALGPSSDVVIRDIKISSNAVDAVIVYIDGLVDRNLLNQDILQPLMFNLPIIKDNARQNHSSSMDFIKSSLLTVGQIKTGDNFDELITKVLKGHVAILIEGLAQVLLIDAKG